MEITLPALNEASIITLDAGDFLKIKIDKLSGAIIVLVTAGKEENRDITNYILDIEAKYSIGDMVIGTPYNLGIVVAKLFKGTVNNRCKKMLNVFDEIILE